MISLCVGVRWVSAPYPTTDTISNVEFDRKLKFGAALRVQGDRFATPCPHG